MKFEDISPELHEKAKACKTPEDIMALAKEEGYTLSDEELESIVGGGPEWNCNYSCENKVYENTCPTYQSR